MSNEKTEHDGIEVKWYGQKDLFEKLKEIIETGTCKDSVPVPKCTCEDFKKHHAICPVHDKEKYNKMKSTSADALKTPASPDVSVEERAKELKRIRNYFGEHDITAFEHWAYSYLDSLIATLSNNVEAKEELESIMSKFGEAHNLLAKTKLTTEEYQPISSLLANGKVELFNFYKKYHTAGFLAASPMQGEGMEKLLISIIRRNGSETDISKAARVVRDYILKNKNK